MQIKYNIKFLLEHRKDKRTGEIIIENVPINCDITYKGKRLRIYSGYRINSTNWEHDKERVTKNTSNADKISASEINKRLTSIESAINDSFDFFIGIEKVPSLDELRTSIKEKLNDKPIAEKEPEKPKLGLFEYYDIYIKEAKVSASRRKQLKSTKNHFYNFDCKLNFEDVDAAVLKKFEKYLKEDKENEKGENTVSCILKKLRAFFSYAFKNSWCSYNPFKDFTISPEKYGDPIFITKAELNHLYNLPLEDNLMSQVRDLFVLQCLIGCRVGDYKTLTKSNIINGAIEYIPSKTSNERNRIVRVPLSSKAMQIITKHKFPGDYLMPFLPEQQYNELIKLLFRKAEITRNVVRLNTKTRKNEIVSIATIASSHMARRTFIGILHKEVKNEVIASMSGHVENSKAFSRYYKIDDIDKKNAILKLE